MSPTRMSRIESAIRVVLKFNEALNRHDIAGMLRLMSDDCIFEAASPAPDGTTYKGKEGISLYWQNFFRNSPHARFELEEIFSLGLRCITRWKYDWEGADGEKKRYIRGADIFQVRDGLICEQRSYLKGSVEQG